MNGQSRIYHIASRSDWDAAAELYRPASLDSEGFIHCSEPGQLSGVANELFRGRCDLVLLCIDPRRVEAPIRYEPAPDRPGVFPHVYGPLELNAVVRVTHLAPDASGRFDDALEQAVDSKP